MQIDVISDTVCPWCFIGKRRLEAALAERPDMDFEINWRPFQLDPHVPAEGMDRADYMRAKFGDGERVKQMAGSIRQVGEGAGIVFAFDAQTRRPNTIDSHRLIHWAHGVGLQNAVVEALFKAYFEQGRDIGDTAVLCDIAETCGMDRELVADLLASDTDLDLTRSEADLAGQMGIQGVPAFIFAGKYAVTGAQDTETLLRIIDKVREKEAAA